MRDHGGNLDGAIKAFGGDRADWIDLSTGINTVPYPVGPISPEAWTRLPERSALGALEDAARRAYDANCAVVPVSGAQAAIQLVPRLIEPAQRSCRPPITNMPPHYGPKAGRSPRPRILPRLKGMPLPWWSTRTTPTGSATPLTPCAHLPKRSNC